MNVDLLRGKNEEPCIAISGDPYLTSTVCNPSTSNTSQPPYTVMSPIEGNDPPLVIGFLPSGKARVAVTAGESGTLGVSRGTVFLAVLAPDALGSEGEVPVEVEFE